VLSYKLWQRRFGGDTNLIGRTIRLNSEVHKDWSFAVVPMHEQFTGEVKPTLLVMLGAVGFALLIGCVNVANLLLARAAGRQKEIAVRAALGADRWRIIRQLLCESLLLALLGGALGIVFSVWGVGALTRLCASNLPRVDEVMLDGTVLGFAVVVSGLTALIFGSVPAVQASRPDLNNTLKEGGRGPGGGSRNRIRSGLIVAEVALALVLLAGAGLLLRSFLRLQTVAPGFDPQNVLSMFQCTRNCRSGRLLAPGTPGGEGRSPGGPAL